MCEPCKKLFSIPRDKDTLAGSHSPRNKKCLSPSKISPHCCRKVVVFGLEGGETGRGVGLYSDLTTTAATAPGKRCLDEVENVIRNLPCVKVRIHTIR